MADQNMTSEESSRILNALRMLEELEASGQIRPAEQRALDSYREKQKTAEQAQIETAATYRGMQSGAAMNLDDEIAGARAAVGEFMRSGDRARANQAYQRYRDLVRQKNEAAQMLAPEQYAKGQMAGAGATALVPGAGVAGTAGRMGMVGRAALGAGTGAALTALPQFAGGEGGFASRVREVQPGAAMIGGAIGGAAPIAGAVAGRAVQGAQNLMRGVEGLPGYAGGAARRVAGRLGTAQRAGTDIEEYLRSIGPEGMMADIPGSPQSMAQGLATMQGEGADIMRRAIEERARGAGQRIEQEMTQQIAGPEAAFMTRREMAQQRSGIFGPLYDAAKQSDQTFNVDALRSGLVFLGRDEASDVRGALNRVLRDLGNEGEISAARLHAARVALNDAKETAFRSGAGGKGAVLKSLLQEFDSKLDQIPGYSDARTGWAATGAINDAIDAGREVFSGGPTSALSPMALKETFAKLSDAQKEAFRQGAREYVSALMGTSRSDAPAAWAAFEKSWNAEKLRTILGDDAANQIMQRLRGEAEFSRTRGRVLEGSQTAAREEARAALADIREPDSMNMPSPITRLRSSIEQPINRVIDEILYGARRSNINRQIGEILSLQGDQRDMAVRALLSEAQRLEDPTRARQIIEALTTTAGVAAAPGLLAQ